MLKIGLTGGIASGKSLASQFFSDLGVEIIDADKIAKQLFNAQSTHLDVLRTHFGHSIFDKNGELNRKSLGQIVFNEPDELKWLNDFTHPLINQQMLNKLSQSNSIYVILDIPLLINKDGKIPKYLSLLIDKIIVIDVPIKMQIERISARDHLSSQAALKIIESQSSAEQKKRHADYIINNSGSIEQLKQSVEKLHDKFIKTIEINEL